MTLVVALAGEDDIVVAADSLHSVGFPGNRFRDTSAKKILTSGNYVVGFAGSPKGICTFQLTEPSFEGKLLQDAGKLSMAMDKMVSVAPSGVQPSRFLLCGFEKSRPRIYRWEWNGEEIQLNDCNLAPRLMVRDGISAIGQEGHGGYLMYSHAYSKNLSLEERVFLAYLCIHEVAEHDHDVSIPIDVSIVKQGRVIELDRTKLAGLTKKCVSFRKRLSSEISRGARGIKLEELVAANQPNPCM